VGAAQWPDGVRDGLRAKGPAAGTMRGPMARPLPACILVSMNVVVLGLGYIGLPTAATLANAGHHVTGVDTNEALINNIRGGCGHIAELDVRALAQKALGTGNLTVTTELPSHAQAYLICVPTPTHAHKPDLHYVQQAADAIAATADDYSLIVLESTVPPGTVERIIVGALEAHGKSADRMHIAHCPERVIPGAIVHELENNARVIGGRRPIDAEIARDLYASFCKGDLCVTDCLTAELVKVVENTFRDVNLAFANELALLSEALGVDVWEVIRLANKHPRVQVLNPGPGVGGHCVPVDPNFLSNANPFVTELIQTARRVNERMPHVVARIIGEVTPPHGAKIALLGAAYKADVDDTRESPTEALLRLLDDRRYNVTVYDPLARDFEHPLSPTIEDAVASSDAIVLLTGHGIFSEIDPSSLAPLVRQKVLIDTRNFFNRERWSEAGFAIRTLGLAQLITAAQAAAIA
jgi:UDP-N-acetyl-D-mannosaminuronic acid dehydrogenase